jgi:hypothetical protein
LKRKWKLLLRPIAYLSASVGHSPACADSVGFSRTSKAGKSHSIYQRRTARTAKAGKSVRIRPPGASAHARPLAPARGDD